MSSTPVTTANAVVIRDISEKASPRQVFDFFSFCGAIAFSWMDVDHDAERASQVAVIAFEEDSAAGTAVLLTNATIADRTVRVSMWNSDPPLERLLGTSEVEDEAPFEQQLLAAGQESPASLGSPGRASPASSRAANNAGGKRVSAANAFLAAAVASTVGFGHDVAAAVKDVDQKTQMGAKLKEVGSNIDTGLRNLDRQLKVSESFNTVGQKLSEPASKVGDALQIKQVGTTLQQTGEKLGTGLKQTGEKLGSGFKETGKKLESNQVVSKGWGFLRNIGTSISASFSELEQETKRKIQEEELKRGITRPVAPTATLDAAQDTDLSDEDHGVASADGPATLEPTATTTTTTTSTATDESMDNDDSDALNAALEDVLDDDDEDEALLQPVEDLQDDDTSAPNVQTPTN